MVFTNFLMMLPGYEGRWTGYRMYRMGCVCGDGVISIIIYCKSEPVQVHVSVQIQYLGQLVQI